ncbi:MAG TPA: hypothetical protein VHR42_05620, partial [Clostridia bacterium]|nr:hypothetical protein [Clostridia bacterium]
VNILNYKGVILYETVSKSGSKYIHGYLPAKTGSIVFKYQYGYTSVNRQPVYSLSGKRTASYLNARQKATMLYMVGKKCAVLFDTKSGKNTGFGVVNFRGKAI